LIEGKVKAINEKYGITKRWWANKYDHYHFLGNVFEIQESVEMGFVEDIERYRDGNYFRTKEEAEEYRDYIVKKSLEWHESRKNNE
jgi:conserved domain protein